MITNKKLQIATSISVIILVIIYFQYPSLQLDMFWDDYALVRQSTLGELVRSFYLELAKISDRSVWIPAYRPLTQWMFHVAYKICGFNSYNLHMMIIILQILQTILAFIFFRMLTQKNSVALAGSLLFPLNPNLYLHFTWSSEIAAMSGMIPFLLSLIILLLYIRNPDSSKMRIHLLFAIWAYLTKETYAPLFFLSILTIFFYRKHDYRKYLPLVGWHMVIFITYLSARFIVLNGLGGYGVTPAGYSGITLYMLTFWNYITFLGKISLFDHYISSGSGSILLYIGIITVLLMAINNVLTAYGKVNRKLLFVISFVFLFPTYWLLTHITQLPELLHFSPYIKYKYIWHPMIYKSFLFLYSIGLYTIIMLWRVNRKSIININVQSLRSLFLLERANNAFIKKPIPVENDRLFKFFMYSCLFLLISGLPMFFLPDSRIMNVTALGMGGIFASGFFIVLSGLGNKTFNHSLGFSKHGLLRFSLLILLILFVLNNGVIFKDKYTRLESEYMEANFLTFDIYSYMVFSGLLQRPNFEVQNCYLFRKLVASGVMDSTTGKFDMEKIIYLYPQITDNKELLKDSGIYENVVKDFQSRNFKKCMN